MAKVFTTAKAEEDLDSIWIYIAGDNPAASDRMLDLIGETAVTISMNPMLGRRRRELASDLLPEVRSFPVLNYLLFYRPVDDGIEIVRVLHGARDIGLVFKD